ncbi:hypothetical protein CCP3SC1_60016 [Gammaproteobacteria bacterium]
MPFGPNDYRVGIGAIRLEASLACQLQCPSCPTAAGQVHRVLGKGFLRANDFLSLIERNPGLHSVELSNYGEPFLNPQMLDLLRIAAKHGVALTCDNGANLNTVREEVLEGLVRYGMRSITCALDGASAATYAIYRRRGQFEQVIENIRTINAYKARYGTAYPHLTWQFVIFGHNEREIFTAKRMADELGMKFRPKLSWDMRFSPIRDRRTILRESGLPATTIKEFQRLTRTSYAGELCHELWTRPQINFDGQVLGCRANYRRILGGNAFEDLDAAINGKAIRYARAMLMGDVPPREDIPCSHCHHYLERVMSGHWIRREEIEPPAKQMSKSESSRHRPSRPSLPRRILWFGLGRMGTMDYVTPQDLLGNQIPGWSLSRRFLMVLRSRSRLIKAIPEILLMVLWSFRHPTIPIDEPKNISIQTSEQRSNL